MSNNVLADQAEAMAADWEAHCSAVERAYKAGEAGCFNCIHGKVCPCGRHFYCLLSEEFIDEGEPDITECWEGVIE